MTIAATANGLELVQDWDKTFPKSDKVEHCKAVFKNRFGITLAADVYKPKAGSGKFAAIAVSGPFGAVKEQSSGLYAQTLALDFLHTTVRGAKCVEANHAPLYAPDHMRERRQFTGVIELLFKEVNEHRVAEGG